MPAMVMKGSKDALAKVLEQGLGGASEPAPGGDSPRLAAARKACKQLFPGKDPDEAMALFTSLATLLGFECCEPGSMSED